MNSVSISDYINKCLESVVFNIDNGVGNVYEKINGSLNNYNSIPFEKSGLKFLTEYTIQAGYKQKSPFDHIHLIENSKKNFKTCFGVPEAPLDFKNIILKRICVNYLGKAKHYKCTRCMLL